MKTAHAHDDLIDDYGEWIKKETTSRHVGDWREITLPLLDSSNDEIGFYAKDEGPGIRFTDDGWTLESFDSKGLTLTPARKQQLVEILGRFGAQMDANENIILAAPSNRPDALNRYAQALVEAQALLSLTTTRVQALFKDDVAHLLDSHHIGYTADIDVRGVSGLLSHFEFVFQKTGTRPTRFCKTPNNFTLDSFRRITWTWLDTEKDPKRRGSELLVIGNDLENPLSEEVLSAYQNYKDFGIKAVSFSDLADHLELVS